VVLGFEAPLTIEIEDILDCPKALGTILTRHSISPILNTMLTETEIDLYIFGLFRL
jgi:hypothetical protein